MNPYKESCVRKGVVHGMGRFQGTLFRGGVCGKVEGGLETKGEYGAEWVGLEAYSIEFGSYIHKTFLTTIVKVLVSIISPIYPNLCGSQEYQQQCPCS